MVESNNTELDSIHKLIPNLNSWNLHQCTYTSAAAGEAEAPETSSDDEEPLRFQGRNRLGELHEFRTEDEDALYEDVDETLKHLIDLIMFCSDFLILIPYFLLQVTLDSL